MHLRHPVVLTTVEEDFKAIGLITEDDEKKDKAGKTGKADDEEVAGDKESSVKKGGKKAESQDDADADQLAELKQHRIKRHTSSERLKWRRAKRRGSAKAASRKYRKKASVKRMMKKHRMKAQRLRHGKAAGRRRIVFSNDTVSNMLEDTQALLASLDEAKVENSIKAFANVAIIAEMLSRSFAKFAEDCEDAEAQENLEQAATVFGEMAEEAADIARDLKEDADGIDFDELEEVFKGQMSDLLNGLEMYADITEDEDLANLGEEDDEDEEDDDEDDEDEKDEAKEEDDEEDEDDDDGGDKKKAPPFMKKGAKSEGHKPGKKRY